MSDATTLWNPYAPLTPATRRMLGIGAVVTVLVAWSIVSATGLVGPNRLPAPWSVAKALITLAWDGDQHRSLLLTASAYSLMRVITAGVLVIALGVPLGILMGAAPRVNAALSPLIDPFRSAPVVALSPILVMWLGIGEPMKIVFLFIGAVVYLIPMVRDAMIAVPQAYWISARDLGATPWESVRQAVLPIAMPRIVDGIVVAVSVMWTYITVAEYFNAGEGLGQLIQNARRFSAMDQVFAGIFVIMALALLSYQLMRWARLKLYPWETSQ
ncbi:MAG: ABC transporter permease [Dokdonella sp.]|uniref:ABC transporter permease n=1 Tax=Dokdonella sp. TaxID=2291710 RepID=UPI0032642C0B